MVSDIGVENLLGWVDVRDIVNYYGVELVDYIKTEDIIEHVGAEDLIPHLDGHDIIEYSDIDYLIDFLDPEKIVDCVGLDTIMEHYDLIERGDKEVLKDFNSEDLMKEALDIEN